MSGLSPFRSSSLYSATWTTAVEVPSARPASDTAMLVLPLREPTAKKA
jgi:hypothetical protein